MFIQQHPSPRSNAATRRREFGAAGESAYDPASDSYCVLYHKYWTGTANDFSQYGNDGSAEGAFVSNGLQITHPQGVSVTFNDNFQLDYYDITMMLWTSITDFTTPGVYRNYKLFDTGNDIGDARTNFGLLLNADSPFPALPHTIWDGYLSKIGVPFDPALSRYSSYSQGNNAIPVGDWHLYVYQAQRSRGGWFSVDGANFDCDDTNHGNPNNIPVSDDIYLHLDSLDNCFVYIGHDPRFDDNGFFGITGIIGEAAFIRRLVSQQEITSYYNALQARFA